ncbi:hypothetical protein DXG01_011978, partial [Tephrocybe rancida]
MPPNAPLSPSGVATVYHSDIKTYTAAQRAAASRAILRHGIYTSGSKSVHLDGGLHPSYVDLHGRRNPEVNGIEELLNDLRGDLFDA